MLFGNNYTGHGKLNVGPILVLSLGGKEQQRKCFIASLTNCYEVKRKED